MLNALFYLRGSAKLKEHVTPNETATEVPEAVKDTIRVAKELSPEAVKCSFNPFTYLRLLISYLCFFSIDRCLRRFILYCG